MKLLFLYDGIYPESLGGVEQRNYDLARALSSRGHSVSLGGPTKSSDSSCPGLSIVSLGPSGSRYNRSGRRSLREALRMAWGCLRVDLDAFDLIETANIPYLHIFVLAMRCRLRKKPLVVTWYEYWGPYWKQYVDSPMWRIHQAVERSAALLGSRTCAVSRLTLERLRPRRNDVAFLSIGIDLEAILEEATRERTDVGPLVYAGRHMAEKRLDLLLHALALLVEDIEPRTGPLLSLIGEGPETDRLRQLTSQLELEKLVTFHGRLPTVRDVWQHLGSARIAVLPSEREGFGIFALESMAVGLPVIYTPGSENAVSELVRSGVEGLAVEPTPEALAGAIRLLLRDTATRRRLGDNARLRAQRYSWTHVAREFEEMARSVLASS